MVYVISKRGNPIMPTTPRKAHKTNQILYKKCISDGDYQQTKGIRSEQRIPIGKIQGFRKFEKMERVNARKSWIVDAIPLTT